MIEVGLYLTPTSNQFFKGKTNAAVWAFFGMDRGNTHFIVCTID